MLELLNEEVQKVDWRNMDEVIQFYESGRIDFADFSSIESEELIIEYIHIKLRYTEALEWKKRYSKAKPILTEINILLQKIAEQKEHSSLYERYVFLSGVICGRLHKRQDALRYFVELRKIDPDNDVYKEWYLNLRSTVYQNQFNALSYIGFALIVFEISVGLFWDITFSSSFTLIALILLASGMIFPYLIKQYFKYRQKGRYS